MAPRTALLVIDMQEFFRSMTTSCLPNVLTLTKHFESSSRPVVFTQHGHSKEELTTDPSPNQLVRKWGAAGSIAIDSSDWRLMKELGTSIPSSDQAAKMYIVPKNTYDAFLAPPYLSKNQPTLAGVMERENIQRVLVCGVMTDCCVDTTARGAFNRGYETWVVSDACGSANKRQHEAGLRGFEFGFGEVMTTKEALYRVQDEG
jgi:nicotinamidase-related amidase